MPIGGAWHSDGARVQHGLLRLYLAAEVVPEQHTHQDRQKDHPPKCERLAHLPDVRAAIDEGEGHQTDKQHDQVDEVSSDQRVHRALLWLGEI